MKGSFFLLNFIIRAKVLLCLACVVFLSNVQAQSSIKEQQHDIYLSGLVDQARAFYNSDPDSLKFYGKKIMAYGREHNYAPAISEAYNFLGVAYENEGNRPLAIENLKLGIAVAIANGQQKTLAALLLNKGNAEEGIGNYVVALEDYLESMRIKSELNDSLGVAKCQNNIAQIYCRQGNPAEALKNFFASLEIKLAFGDSASIVKTYNNIGVTYNEMKEYDLALRYFDKALEIYTIQNNQPDRAMVLGNIAWTYDLMGKKDQALVFYLDALALQEEVGELFDIVVTRINAGSLYLERKDYKNAEKFLLQGLKEGQELSSLEDQKEAFKYLAQLYSEKGEYKKALDYQKQLQVVSDSLLNEEKTAALSEMIVKYESEKKDEQNKVLQKENEIQGIMLERNRYVNAGLAVFSILILIIALLFISQTRLSARQQTMELEQKILRSQMNPHFIFNSLQSIQGFIFESNPLEAGKYLSDFARLMRLILENSKTEYISLAKEVETLHYYLLLQQLRFSTKMEYQFDIDESIDREAFLVPPMLMQPFIENAIEHGIKLKEHKGKVTVTIKRNVDYFTFVVEDDGVGRNYHPRNGQQNPSTHQSMATSITGERLKLINKRSQLKINMTITDLQNPTGTRVVFRVPVKELI